MTLKVCVGSSCHLKGSYDVIETLKKVLKKYDVEDLVELQASFCLGACAKGVTVKCDGLNAAQFEQASAVPVEGGLFLHNVNSNNVEEVFAKEIFPLLNLK